MKYIAFTLLALAVGCSAFDPDKELAKIGITRPESRNFFMAVSALTAACKESDLTSVQACKIYMAQNKSIPDMERFAKNAFWNPDSLTSSERTIFDNITLVGAAYRQYIEAKRSDEDRQRLWNSFAAGAAVGTLFSRPTPPPQLNCTLYGSGNYQSGQCQ